ncbi:MAG TPA: hypothetical protein DDY32_03230 [Desulfobulbaceae bacterium]|nr:hypothetical protein [Desulfobulbaceae bacterium]
MRLLCNNRGQGMTEYIIIVALIAIAAIGAFTYFGKSVRMQTAAMSESVAGDSAAAKSTIDDNKGGIITAEKKEASTTKNLQTYVEQPK